jgi:hypothetical protein
MIHNQTSEIIYELTPPVPGSFVIPYPYQRTEHIQAFFQTYHDGAMPYYTDTELVYGVGYTVSDPAIDNTGGTLTLIAAVPAGASRLKIRRHTLLTQELALENGARLDAKLLEKAFDKQMLVSQENLLFPEEFHEFKSDTNSAFAVLQEELSIETSERQQTDTQERASRINADAAEAAARAQVYTTLDNAITNEYQVRIQADNALQANITAEQVRAENAEQAISEEVSALQGVQDDYVKKEYALDKSTTPTYQMLKAVTWTTDASGHVTLHAWMRDLSGVIEADIEDDLVAPLASESSDGVMPKESFATIEQLVTQVSTLIGSIIPRGEIPQSTEDVTQEILTAYIQDVYGRLPQQGDALKDVDNLTWVFGGNSLWVQWGDSTVAQATNDDGETLGILGTVKGKNLDGYVFIENDGSIPDSTKVSLIWRCK